MSKLTFRKATLKDVPTIVEMLNNDALGRVRESVDTDISDLYFSAFREIDIDPNQELTVVELDGEIVGTFQLTYIQYLTYKGGKRVLVEAVRVNESQRGKGLGRKMFEHIIEKAIKDGAHMIQLTSNKKRERALSFYQSLGFESTHEGFKLHL